MKLIFLYFYVSDSTAYIHNIKAPSMKKRMYFVDKICSNGCLYKTLASLLPSTRMKEADLFKLCSARLHQFFVAFFMRCTHGALLHTVSRLWM